MKLVSTLRRRCEFDGKVDYIPRPDVYVARKPLKVSDKSDTNCTSKTLREEVMTLPLCENTVFLMQPENEAITGSFTLEPSKKRR